MKLKQFALKSGLYTMLIVLVLFLLDQVGNLVDFTNWIWIAIPFLYCVTLFTFYFAVNSLKKSGSRFVTAVYGGMAIRMFFTIFFMVIYLIINDKMSKPFILTYLFLYLFYTMFEIIILVTTLRTENTEDNIA